MYAVARNLRISYKKANLVAGLVRRKNVEYALAILENTPKKASGMLAKVIASAAANAVSTFKQNIKDLYIKEIIVNEGITMKRSVPISRGRMHPILKRSCHVTVKLESKAGEKKVTKKETVKTNEEVKAETPKVEEKTEVKVKTVTKKASKAKQ